MSFPTTGILDNFDRANAANLGANWSLFHAWAGGSSSSFGISSNTVYNDNTSDWVDMYYNPATYGPDCECYLTLSTLPVYDGMGVKLRGKDPGANSDCYEVVVSLASPNVWGIYRMDDGVETRLGSSFTQSVSAGEKIGIEAIGDTIKAYHYTGGAWSEKSSGGRVDSTYGAAGYLTFYGEGSDVWRYDDFGGGTVAGGGGTVVPVFMASHRQHWR
jgi:hypothetical protein